MTAAKAIDYYARDHQFERIGEGAYVEGVWVDGASTASTIRAAVFSPSSRDLLDLEEGQRTKIVWTLWSRSEIRATDEDLGVTADLVEVQGHWFRVVKVWPRLEGGYFKALLERDVERSRSIHSTTPVVAGGDWA